MQCIEQFIEKNEDRLMEYWDEYKYEFLCGEYFHHDDVDYFNEQQFLEMADYIIQNNIKL